MAISVPPHRVTVIGGGGMVGAATVNALVLQKVPAEILIVDVVAQAAMGQALDIADASFTGPSKVRVGTFQEAGQSDVVIITAGYPQKPGESRAQLLGKNKEIIKNICDQMKPMRKDTKILVVANPVDVLTHLAWKFSGLPKEQVFGSGTYLDSGRLRVHLSGLLNVSPQSIDAYVLGEHGDRQFVAWSSASVHNSPLIKHPAIAGQDLDAIRHEVMRKAYSIIEAKRSTYFGIGMCTATITASVLANDMKVYPLVNWSSEHGAYISWPCSVGIAGVAQQFPVPLDASESEKLKVAVTAIKEMVNEAEAL